MSDKGVIKDLGLEKYFWSILDSSQDAQSGSSSNSLSRRSTPQEDTVEKKRGEAIEQEIEAKPHIQEKKESVTKINILHKLKTPSQDDKPFFGSPSLFNAESQENDFISKASLTASGRKSPFMNFSNPPADTKFLEFDPQVLQTEQKKAKSHTSPVKDTFPNVEPVVKIKFTPAAQEEKFKKQRSGSLDEDDFELISMILEEEAKKSGNEDGAHTVKSLPIERTKSNEENNKDLEENTRGNLMPTLQTASLKPIASRTENMARAQAMIDDDEFGDQSFPLQGDQITESPKLQTASFKNIPIKQGNPSRKQNMLGDDDEDDELGQIFAKHRNNVRSNVNNKPSGTPKLQPASFKNIPVKQGNPSRIQNALEGDEDDELGQIFAKHRNNVRSNVNNKPSGTPKLQTASFQNIPIKQESLARIQKIFVEEDDDDGLGFPVKKSQNSGELSNKIEESPKLQTASFKSIPIKQESLARSKNIFADNEDDFGFGAPKSESLSNNDMPMLQTASFKPIFVKQENVARINKMFADGETEEQNFPPQGNNSNSNGFQGIQTASFKPINIKQENLAHVQNMFGGEDDSLGFITSNNDNIMGGEVNNKIEDSPKLQTASFKSIPVKQESLAQFKNMFADNDDDFGFSAPKSENLSNNDMPMLQTASFKPISIKQENVARINKMFADDETEEPHFPPQDNNNDSNGFQGLQTASFKPINIKQENMDRIQNMFAGDNEEEDELSAIFKKNKNRNQQKMTVNNNSTLSRINNLFKEEDAETSTGFKKQTVNNSKAKDEVPDTNVQNAEAFSGLASQRSFSFKNSIKASIESEMEIEAPKLITASFKPNAIKESKLKRIEGMPSDDEDTNKFPFGANSKFGRENKMSVENSSSSFGLFTKEENSKNDSSNITKYNLQSEDSKQSGPKKVINVKFDRVMKGFQTENKEVSNKDNEPEITYKPLPPLIQGDENNVVPRDSDFLESAFNQLNQSQSNSNFEASLSTGNGKKLQFNDKNLEDAFKLLTADSQEEAPSREPAPEKFEKPEKLEVEEQKENKKEKKINSAPSPPLTSRDMQPVKKVLKQDLRVQKSIKKIKLNTENLKIPDRVPVDNNRFLTKSSTDAKSVKKNQGFKFTKENNSSNGNSPQPVEKTKSMKRSYDEITKDNKGIVFPNNPKVQAYNMTQEARARKLIKPRKTYFQLENLNKSYFKISNEVRSVSVYTALDRKFICPCTESFSSQADLSNPLNYDVCYCNGNLLIGWYEIMQELLKDGLEQNHLKENWIKNHYRNIVWKLASIERRLKSFHATKHLTADNVKKELEYRYYVEYVEGKRSVIQKIIEKDEPSTGHLVLLVGEIIKKSVNKKTSYLVELSDGWYSVYFEIKPEEAYKTDKKVMTNNQLFFMLVNSKKLYPGMKVHVVGMKMLSAGGKQDAAKPSETENPEEASSKIIVEIDYNSICRASWDAKLGLSRSLCFPKSLLSIRNHGGSIPMIDVFVIKKYKMLEKAERNVKQYQGEEEGSTKGKVFLKIRVGDAIIYHNPENPQQYQDVFCEIEISGISDDEFAQIKENERIKFYNLKSISNPERNQPYYDNEKKKHFHHCLYLEFIPRTSRYQTVSAMGGTFRQDANKFKDFAKENYKSYYYLTSLELDSPHLFNFYQKDIRFCRNEIDMIGLVIETTPSKIFGCIGNGHFFQISLHSRPFFSNIKILDKKNTIINFRALQFHTVEKLGLNEPCCFFLRTNDYTSFGNLPSSLQSEAEILNSISKDQTKMETYREKINMIMKKY